MPLESALGKEIMKKPIYVLMILFTFSAHVLAQKKIKPSGEWSEKDARKILDDSPWGQTQIETDTSEMFYSPTTRSASDSSRAAQGATNQATHVNFHIRFLSAKPIRQAIARSMELQQKSPNPQLSEQLRSFVDRKFDDWIVVAVTYD